MKTHLGIGGRGVKIAKWESPPCIVVWSQGNLSKKINISLRIKLLTGTVPVNNSLLTWTVPVNNSLLTQTVPVINSLLTGTWSLSIISYWQKPYYIVYGVYLTLDLDCLATSTTEGCNGGAVNVRVMGSMGDCMRSIIYTVTKIRHEIFFLVE